MIGGNSVVRWRTRIRSYSARSAQMHSEWSDLQPAKGHFAGMRLQPDEPGLRVSACQTPVGVRTCAAAQSVSRTRSSVDRAARKVSRTPGANADGIGYTRSNGIIRAGTILDRPLPFPFRRCITGYSAWPLLLAMQRMRRLPIERKAAHDASGLVTPPTLLSASIGQVDDHARFDTVDRDVRFIDKASESQW